MDNKHKFIVLFLLIIDFVFILKIIIGKSTITFFDPQGWVALQEHNLVVWATLVMLAIVIPVFILLFWVGWKYREANSAKNTYTPDWDHSTKMQIGLWGILSLVIIILSVVNWQTAHKMDPHKSLVYQTKPIKIQVVALRWKWLFIYPEQKIATVNVVAFPEKTPIDFELTSDAPMNSFWIPQLGGQMYTMTGMVTPLHLVADHVGNYTGSTAELSGAGFAGMRFAAKSLTQIDFDHWVVSVKASPQTLNFVTYGQLAAPSEDAAPVFYSSTENDLYNTIIKQFMEPNTMNSRQKMTGMSGM